MAKIGGQARVMSFIESCVNVSIGYGVAIISQIVVFPIYNIHVDLSTNLYIGAWFTLISIARSYLLRRGFNWLHTQEGMKS